MDEHSKRGFHPILPVIFSVPDFTDPRIGTGAGGIRSFSWQDLLMDDPFLFFFVWAWEDPGPPEDTQRHSAVDLNQRWLAREAPIDDFRVETY